ncbi:C40 family peptidase [Paenibacillus pini]|uniref:NLP/P60 family protein n=1 Tax=Paenibacillus pini JCM 16418 TaxID=1236976 RepID=W7YHV8_9BACL|nr:C40 family peptidase [Paenibacillus pini]GAF10490.1 NLP/P60 family protein [Paenibacillus pini JCM 16418]
MINIKNRLLGCLLVTATLSAAVLLPTPSRVDASSAKVQAATSTGIIQSTVKLRDKPSMASNVVAYLKNGDRVQIMEKSTAYFYKIKTSTGKIGYTSVSDQYIKVNQGSGSVTTPDTNTEPPVTTVPPIQSNTSKDIENVIKIGMNYLGTPYEYGSDRNTTTTFDCSDFIRQIYKEGAGITLPSDSRKQGTWIKENSKAVSDTSKLKRGDLVFFMSYKGSNASSYQGINKLNQTITHVALYLGDNKLLHTYSIASGGVKVTDFSDSWKNRFMYGGSVE